MQPWMFWHSTVSEMGRGLLDWRKNAQKSKQRPFHQLFVTHSAWTGSPVLESEPSFNLTTYFSHLFLEEKALFIQPCRIKPKEIFLQKCLYFEIKSLKFRGAFNINEAQTKPPKPGNPWKPQNILQKRKQNSMKSTHIVMFSQRLHRIIEKKLGLEVQ